jgi:tol-pal system protein YbgF
MLFFRSAGASALAVAFVLSGAQPSAAGFWDFLRRDPPPPAPAPVAPAPGVPMQVAPAPVAVPAPGLAQQPAPMVQSAAPPVQAAGDLATRVDRIETQIRALTGQIEQITFQLQELRSELAAAAGEAGAGALPFSGAPMDAGGPITPEDHAALQGLNLTVPPPPGLAGAAQPIGSAVQGQPPASLGTVPVNSAPPGAPLPEGGAPISLSALAAGAAAPPPPAAAPAPMRAPDAAPPEGAIALANPGSSAREDYDLAYQAILSGDYAIAEGRLRMFLGLHPQSALAADAQYWLGESLYARGMYREAADAFLTGYNNYPNSPKAPDSMLKLGLSLAGLGEKAAACSTYAETLRNYPSASNALLQRVRVEQTSAGC